MRRLLFAIALSLAACSSNPSSDVVTQASATAAPPPTATAEASVAPTAEPTPPEPPKPAAEKPFSLVAEIGDTDHASIIGDTIGTIGVEYDGMGGAVPSQMVDAFELVGTKFVRLNAKTIRVKDGYVSGLSKQGSTIYLDVAKQYGRGYGGYYIPVKGNERRPEVADFQGQGWALFNAHVPPPCHEKSKNGVEPMNGMGEFADFGGATFIVGGSCTKKDEDLLQIVIPGQPSKHQAVGKRPRLLTSKTRLYLVDAGKVSEWMKDKFGPPFDLPEASDASALVDAPDGSAILTMTDSNRKSGDRVRQYVRRDVGWRPLELPDGSRSFSLYSGDNSLWAFSDKAIHRYVAPGSPKPEVADVSTLTKAAMTPHVGEKPFLRKTPGEQCQTNLVVLYGFTKVTPEDYDFPLTRDALKGHEEFSLATFFVTEERGQKYFVAYVPQYDFGRYLAWHIEKNVKGSKPQVVCAEPKVLRILDIDLTTGKLISNEVVKADSKIPWRN